MIRFPSLRPACLGLWLCALACSPVHANPRDTGWRDAFQSSPADYDFVIPKGMNLPAEARERLRDRPAVTGTLRARFALALGGRSLRIRFSNEEGSQPFTIVAASVGIAAERFDARPGTLRRLTFGGKDRVTLPAGSPALSDPIELAIEPMTELVVSVRVPAGIKLKPFGSALMATAPGDQTLAERMKDGDTIVGRPLVSGAEVLVRGAPRVLVALGDSITDGNRAALGELRSWPEQLQRRLLASPLRGKVAIVNAGIGGNRVLSTSWGKSALARFDRDVGRIGHVSHLILLEGINDIAHGGKSVLLGDNPPLEVAELIAGYRQIIARAHARGIKVVMATLTPFEGNGAFTAERESQRGSVNAWIRTSGEPDAVIDFDEAVRDPAHPLRLRPDHDSGDHLHPNANGYRAMGDAIRLSIFD